LPREDLQNMAKTNSEKLDKILKEIKTFTTRMDKFEKKKNYLTTS